MIQGTDLKIYQGDDKDFTIIVFSGKNAVNLTNCNLIFKIKNLLLPVEHELVITKDTSSGITITDATHGKATLSFDHADTNTLEARSYQFSLTFVDVNNKHRTLLVGNFEVIKA